MTVAVGMGSAGLGAAWMTQSSWQCRWDCLREVAIKMGIAAHKFQAVKIQAPSSPLLSPSPPPLPLLPFLASAHAAGWLATGSESNYLCSYRCRHNRVKHLEIAFINNIIVHSQPVPGPGPGNVQKCA